MHIRWTGIACLVGALAALTGCTSTDKNLGSKPPLAPPAYVLPPQDEARYSNPPAPPEKTLNKGPFKATDPMNPGNLRRPSVGGAGGGLGRY